MKVKFWCGKDQETIELDDNMTENEVAQYFYEWLEQKADGGFDLVEGSLQIQMMMSLCSCEGQKTLRIH